jgi:hypothetical protein
LPGCAARRAAAWDGNEIRLRLSFSEAYKDALHLYALDWDHQERRERITVDGRVAELTASFSNGAWVSVPIEVAAGGSISIVVQRTAGVNAVLSGILLG